MMGQHFCFEGDFGTRRDLTGSLAGRLQRLGARLGSYELLLSRREWSGCWVCAGVSPCSAAVSGVDLSKTKRAQFPQPLLIRLVLQTLHQLPCPSLDTLQHLNVLLVLRGPKRNTVVQVWPHQCRAQGHDHFPSPAGHTIPDTSQDAVGFLGHLGILPARVQPAVNQHPQVLFRQAAFQPLFPSL
ncbi:hypothetical protein QYF61_007412 [Mycteria americana]|uniref:Uncharacterized protein n=1 Tax=Mycteria americana TaxID=33587 RepID=A0AAN7NM20_MYCAM|nr:hypothetical protein QYF61_007412 [Mycteria americana]